eukprot:m.9756 g.9756  ORF g.9756 m.9756 type:complete len:557 (-) comp3588_c0_seq1:159-1829(-)
MALVDYDASSDEETAVGPAPTMSSMQIVLAPTVGPQGHLNGERQIHPSTKELFYNPTVQELYAPQLGPANPTSKKRMEHKNVLTGYVEEGEVSAFQFENQRRTFDTFGYAMDPSVDYGAGNHVIGDLSKAKSMKGESVATARNVRPGDKRKRLPRGDAADIESFAGPWAGYEDDVLSAKPSEEQMAELEKRAEEKQAKTSQDVDVSEARKEESLKSKTILHIPENQLYDYQGRSYMHPPTVEGVTYEAPERCFLPKKCIHTWSPGHTKGVSAIRFFPNSGHLLLSAGLDAKIKLWEVYGKRRLIRTFIGHKKAVRDINFNADGTKFASASYDNYVRVWDTETGECLNLLTIDRVPYCVKFHPTEQHLVVAGTKNKKIICWDLNTEQVVQEYDRHLGPVNTITFVDGGKRMVTTSDDKSIRVWEWNIPVDTKVIAEPSMHSMPCVAVNPTGKFMCCQSLDNKIVTYGAGGRFRPNQKKTFKGHMTAGYACNVGFSADGKYVISGDGEGFLYVFDWRTTKIFKKIKAHDNVCIDVQWNPCTTSQVATCSWDGTIKYWD